ncbi:helix-turn-helix domain-containing protein [Paracoccus tibetensis]|uniref:Helix-turn-helix domain-containing protein n=1 Tax=Paracoccus tibetensis TaxID=336292 RepID=A0A1G5IXU2_9RHOB|nr:helix-turn-helix domain-containing protein [Paracoccus tibetensis]SCY80913.1 Helix-turn-helix domain-containing protein [Paracoccus tibetensis]
MAKAQLYSTGTEFEQPAAATRSITQETVPVARLINQEIAAGLLGVSPKWLERDRWAERRIPYVKIGRLVRYRASDIAAYIDANTQGAA